VEKPRMCSAIKVWDGASKEVGAPASRIHGRSHTLTPWNKDLESSTRVETAPLTRQNYPDGPKTARARKTGGAFAA